MTERRDVFSRTTGELIGRHYVYPDGYHYARGERPGRDDFRLALLALRLREASGRGRGRARLRKVAG